MRLGVFRQVRQTVVAMAALLMALLAVQTPFEQAHLDADLFQAATTMIAQPPERVVGVTEDRASTPSPPSTVQSPTDHHTSQAPASGAHHHHADGPSLYGSAADATAPTVSLVRAGQFQLTNDHRAGLTGNPQDRPPRPALEHVA